MDNLARFLHILTDLNFYISRIIAFMGPWTYLVLMGVVFFETGVVVLALFLPSDTLVFTAATFAGMGDLNVWVTGILFIIAAIGGDSLNFLIGYLFGPRAFGSRFWLLKPENLDKARVFYARYGARTVMYGRFVPVIRSLVPFVAGSGPMKYRRFLPYSIAGSVLWVVVFTVAGYFFGTLPFVQKNFVWVMTAVALVTLLPGIVQFLLESRRGGAAA